MKFLYYLITILIIGIMMSTGWFNGSQQQPEIDSVMRSVKNRAIKAVDAVTEGAVEGMHAAYEMANMAEKISEELNDD